VHRKNPDQPWRHTDRCTEKRGAIKVSTLQLMFCFALRKTKSHWIEPSVEIRIVKVLDCILFIFSEEHIRTFVY